MRLLIFCLLFAFAESNTFAASPVFQEKGGLVAIEAESTTSRLGDWKKKTDVKGFQGECHLELMGKNGDTIVVLVNGTKYALKIPDLSDKDLKFLKSWQPSQP